MNNENDKDIMKMLAPRSVNELEEILRKYPLDVKMSEEGFGMKYGDKDKVDEPTDVIEKAPWYRSRSFFAAASLVLAVGIGAAVLSNAKIKSTSNSDISGKTENISSIEAITGADGLSDSDKNYKAVPVEIPSGAFVEFLGWGCSDDGYSAVYSIGQSLKIWKYDKELKFVSEKEINVRESSDELNLRYLCSIDDGGNIYILTSSYQKNTDDDDWMQPTVMNFSLSKFDSSLNELSYTELPELDEIYVSYGQSPFSFMSIGDEKFIMSIDSSGGYLMDSSGALTKIEGMGNSNIGVTSGGTPVLNFYDSISFINEKGQCEEKLSFLDDWIECNMLKGDSGFELYILCKSGIYGLKSGGETELIVDFSRAGIVFDIIKGIGRTENGFVICADGRTGDSLFFVEPNDKNSETELKKVSIEVVFEEYDELANIIGSQQRDTAMGFSSSSDKYYADIKPCSGKTELMREILSGDAPDVLIYDDALLTERLINIGAAADIYKLSEEYGGLQKEDILPNVRTALETHGGLYRASDSFRLSFLAADKKLIGRDYGCFGFEEFYDLYDKKKPLLYGWSAQSRDKLFLLFCGGKTEGSDMISQWIDGSSCSFDSDEFISLLKLCKEAVLPSESEMSQMSYGDMCSQVMNGGSMISDIMIIDQPYDIVDVYDSLGASPDDAACFANIGSSSGGRLEFDSFYTVMENGSCKEGAWEFIRYVLGEEHQTAMGEEMFHTELLKLRTNKNAFENELQKSVYINENSDGTPTITDAHIKKLRELVENSTVTPCGNSFISGICYEEYLSFINGETTAEQCAEMIQNRVSLYLSEIS